jgi:AP-1-like factor
VLQLGGDPNPSPDGNCSDASGSTNTSRRTRKKRPRDPATTAAGPSAGFPQGDSRSGSTEPSGRQMVGVVSAGAMPISVASNAASPSAMLGSSYGSTPASPGYRSVQELLNQPGPSSAAGTPIGSPSTAMGGFVTHGPLSPPVWTPYQTPYQIQPPPFAYQRTSPSVLSGPGFDVASLPSAASLKASSTRTTADDVDVDCGFCTENDTCVCRMIKEDASLGGRNGSASGSTLREAIALDTKPIVPVGQVSGIDRPQPATGAAPMETVALLRRRPKKTGSQSIWAVVPAPALPECTGDPSNCPACADDPFGKAFCEELGTEPPAEAEVVQHQEQQIKREQEDVTMTVSCCGAPEACGSDAHACSTDGAVADGHKHLTLGVDGSVAQGDGKMIPVADAWRQFKVRKLPREALNRARD